MRFRTATLSLLVLLLLPGACARKPAPAAAKSPAAPASAASASAAPVPEAPAPVAPAAATPTPLPYEARLGKVTFTHYCQTCHGETGAGDGFNAFNVDPHPRDLSDPEFQKKKSDADLADAIQRGGAGVGLSALMPPWGHTLSARQIDEVVLYLRTLPTLRKPAS
ncbi:MAG TPA: cytochrome c [Thermoanaerobaculia bacterium]|nr:cytochrome c [Thermoanaerobaculia bacterium]